MSAVELGSIGSQLWRVAFKRWPVLIEELPTFYYLLDAFVYNNTHNLFFIKAIMRGEKRKSSKKTKQEVNIDWILGSQEPTPIAFFRLTHPTARARAFEKYRKSFNLALDRSEDDKLDRLRAVNNDVCI